MNRLKTAQLWMGRTLIGVVLFVNIQSALAFFFGPETYAPWYELQGAAGDAAIQGFGVLFLMWNIPYVVAFIQPRKYRISLYEAITMQAIGLIGESLIWKGLPAEHAILSGSILRFMAFDSGGLILLILAAWLTRQVK